MLVEILHERVGPYAQGDQVPSSSFTTTELARLVSLGAVRELGEEESVSPGYQETYPPFEEFEGLSTEDKPSGEDIDAGSVFRETDTGERWMWNGESWAEISREELSLRLQFRQCELMESILEALQGDDDEFIESTAYGCRQP